jgi:O-antigen/teichoic acid export membrane protein
MLRMISELKKDRLVNNSFYLVAASAVTSVLGFVFWIICARLFSSEQVGLAAALISAMALICTFCTFGFDFGIIRFWKKGTQKQLVASCSTISLVASLIAGLVFVVFFAGTRFPALGTNPWYALAFIILSSGWVLFNLNDSVYVAMHTSKDVLLKQSVFSLLKLGFPFLFVSLGFFGIFGSWALAAFLALVVIMIYHPVPFGFHISWHLVRRLFSFSMYNYLSTIFTRLRELLLPLLIAYIIGASFTAYYYLAFSITLVFMMVPKAISKAMLAEISHRRNAIRSNLRKSLGVTLAFSIAVLVFVLFLGRYALLLYGSEYAENSLALLNLFAISGIFAGVSETYYTLMRADFKLRQLLVAQSGNSLLTIGLSLLLLGYGLIGVGVAWLVSEMATSLFVISVYRKLNPMKVLAR